MAINSRERKGQGWLWAGAFASALTMTPAAPFRMDASAQTRATAGAELARVGGNYIRETDASAPGQVLTELGRFPYAENRAEAFQNLEAAIDALIASEGINVRHREAILRTVRADSNFTNFSITGVHPSEISSGEVVDAMMSRGGRVIGTGTQLVRMNTPVVEGRTGRVGYRAERWVVDLGADGLLVITLPAECNNWAVKLISRSEIASPVAPEAPCPPQTFVSVEGLPANSRVTMVLTMRDGAQIRSIDGRRCPGSTIPDTCPDCTREVAEQLAREVATYQRERVRVLSAETYTADQDGELVVGVGRRRFTLTTGETVTIDLAAGLQDGSISLTFSCPRNERGRGTGNSGLLEQSDMAQAVQARPQSDRRLEMTWTGSTYRTVRH